MYIGSVTDCVRRGCLGEVHRLCWLLKLPVFVVF